MNFRGIDKERDPRLKKEKRNIDYPVEYQYKVNFDKVKIRVLKKWIGQRIQEILGNQDDVLNQFVYNALKQDRVDPKELEENIRGFLEDDTRSFVLGIWRMLISAQHQPDGVPTRLKNLRKRSRSR